MKILSGLRNASATQTGDIQPRGPKAWLPNGQGPRSSGDSRSVVDSTELSRTGKMVSELRAEASSTGGIRPDVVAHMKREISSGRLGSHEDIERAIDRLLQEL